MPSWDNVKVIDSSDTNVSKLVFTNATSVAEAVLYKYGTYEDRTVICCSTQSGCPVGCRFCGAGDYFIKSLSASEIIDQVDTCFAIRNIDAQTVKRGQIMFMSMGEPMLNWKNLSEAIHVLSAKYPNFALLVSTIGPKIPYEVWENFIRTAQQIDKIGLQFSVHEPMDELRDKRIPFKAKLPLSEIARIGSWFHRETGRQAFFNYCAHDRNTDDYHADLLLNMFDPHSFQCTVSVICERDESVAAANARQEKLATDFMAKMSARGFSTRTFNPAGQDDIGGGCGQLWYVQDFMRSHSNLANPSVGHGLPKVHTPA